MSSRMRPGWSNLLVAGVETQVATRRELIAAAGVTVLLAGLPFESAEAEVADPPSVDDLYAPASTVDVALSPNGKRVAVLRNRALEKGVIESWIEVVDAEHPENPRKIVQIGRRETSAIEWANDGRFLVWITYDVTHGKRPTEKIVRVISLEEDTGLAAVLFGDRGEDLTYIHDLGRVVDMLPDDPDHILMVANEASKGLPGLFRVDVRTGHAGLLEYGASGTITWHTQDGVAMLRLDEEKHGSLTKMMARAPGEREWKFVRAMRPDQFRQFDILGATRKPGVFLCAAREADEDKVSIREIELAGLTVGAPLHKPRSVDVADPWLDARGNLLAIRWNEDRVIHEFTDPAMARHMTAIESHIDRELNIVPTYVDDGRQRVVGVAQGPRQPGLYFLYDGATQAFTELGRARPDILPARLGGTLSLRVATRDGAEIPAYLTRPASGAPGPLIVYPHGGPEARDDYGFDLRVQAMVAQGWWVLQPNFRGSGGYGVAFARAGWKRWGDRMQEDVEDAVAKVLAEHRLDAQRVAIVGGSYGGYAAQMGAVRRPDLYRAVISLAGVSDLPAMLKWEAEQDLTPAKDHLAFWRARIGDPTADADLLARGSPRRRVSEIKAPMLLIHGELDDIVPVEQSRDMAKAMKAAGKRVEYVEQKLAGHGAATPKQDRERLTAMIAFLKQHLA